MPVQNYGRGGPDSSAPAAIMRACFSGGSDEFSTAELLKHLYASEMIGCRYFCEALSLYVRCLRSKASCILQKDIYPFMSSSYETSGACIDAAIRRWVKRSWKDPEMREFFYAVSDGEIVTLPSNKRLLHLMARTLVFEGGGSWDRPQANESLHGSLHEKVCSMQQSRKRAEETRRRPVRYYSCMPRKSKKQTLPFYMSDCEKSAHDAEKVSEP